MTMFAFSHEQQEQIGAVLDEHMEVPVSIEVWGQKEGAIVRTDRPAAPHADDTVRLARLLSGLHPALTVTLYDLDRHASRAVEAGIDRAPTTVLRGRSGRDVRVIGFWTGQLFPAVVDVITYLSKEDTPLQQSSKDTLAKLEGEVRLDILGALYDPHSALMLRLCGAIAAQSRRVRLQFTDVCQHEDVARSHEVDMVPVLYVNARRFLGTWFEEPLVQQVAYAGAGSGETAPQGDPQTTPYYSEADLERMQAANEAAQQGAEPGRTPGGLYLPS